jgi:para-nitrobenzyl esterase
VRAALARWVALVLGPALLLTACQGDGTPQSRTSPFVVETSYGALHGLTDDGAMVWRGIPYAAPPVGDLRWRAPEEPAAWDGVREATAYGPSTTSTRTVSSSTSRDPRGMPPRCR